MTITGPIPGQRLGGVRGIPPAEDGKYLKSTVSGPVWSDPPGGGGGGSMVQGTWNWTTRTSPTVSGDVNIDSAAWNTAVNVQISKTNKAGTDTTNVLTAIEPGDTLYLQDSGDSTKWGRYKVNQAGIDQGSWMQFLVTLIDAGAGGVPNNNRSTTVIATHPAIPGPQGPIGPTGNTGPQGPQGVQGPPGPLGPQGSTGAQGNPGTTGATGAQGAKGDKGDQGLPGPTGPQGTQGSQGPQGNTGPQGATGSVDVVYNGQYPAGTPYTDGDLVVGADGIVYMCVRPTSAAPTPWTGVNGLSGPPGPQGPQGPTGIQGPAGAGIPTVQNGKWLAGSGGAAVWQSISQSDLPANLAASGAVAPGKDLNNATANGWYTISQDADQYGPTVNRPSAVAYGQVETICHSTGNLRQVCYEHGNLNIWQRYCYGSTNWSPWVQTQFTSTGWVNVTTFLNGWHNYGDPYPPARVRQLASGLVVMSGLLSGGTSGDAFTLPAPPPGAQFIPDTYRHMGGWSVDLIGSVRVQTNGNVSLTSSSLAYFTLDNVVYWPRAA